MACSLALFLWALLVSGSASAQAPFYTDDTDTTDVGTLHIEAFDEIDGLQSMQYPDLRQNTANLKINFGLPYGLELDLDAPYLIIDRAGGSRTSRGLGDTNMGVKWHIRDGSDQPFSPAFAVSFYTEFPTGDVSQELGSGVTDYWLNLIMQAPVTKTTRFNVNLGILFAGNTSTGVVGIETKRGHVYTGGVSFVHDLNSKLSMGAEIYGGFADSNGLDRTQLQAMIGAQYAVSEHASIYAGIVAGKYTASPRLGGQIGFAVDFPNFFPTSKRPERASLESPTERPSFHL